MSNWTDRSKPATEEEARAFIKGYPRPLERDVARIYEPPFVSWNDFTLGDWPDSVVASCMPDEEPGKPWSGKYENWRILK